MNINSFENESMSARETQSLKLNNTYSILFFFFDNNSYWLKKNDNDPLKKKFEKTNK